MHSASPATQRSSDSVHPRTRPALESERAAAQAEIDRAYWAFTRTRRGQPPALVVPGAYRRRALAELLLALPSRAARALAATPAVAALLSRPFCAHPALHRCSCGRVRPWTSLRPIGVMEDEVPLELRNCVCGSTCSREIVGGIS